MESTRRPGGRKHKGPRHATMVRLPDPIYAEVARLAGGEGLPVTDYLTRVVAEAHGRQAPPYCYPPNQTELPIAHRHVTTP